MKSVALICFDNPFLKPIEGGKRGMLSRIKALASLDIELDVYLLNKTIEGMADFNKLDLGSNVHFFQYQMNSLSPAFFLSRYPVCCCKRYVSKLVDELEKHDYDVAFYEGAQVALYRVKNKVKASKHILYYHDIESKYRLQQAESESNPLKKMLQRVESNKFERLEKSLPSLFDSHLFVSCDECEKFDELHSLGSRAKYFPYAVDYIQDEVSKECIPGRILYVGDLTLSNNYESLLWFVEKVLCSASFKDLEVELRIIGRISEEKRSHLTAIDRRVNVLGYVDDLNAEYNDAAVMISPILFGAGVKVKLLDALGRGQIVVANKKACEGTRLLEGDNLLIADDPAEYAVLCKEVLENRNSYLQVAENGLEFIRKHHSLEAHAASLLAEIEND